jgi:hypothetical protein
MTSLTGQTIDAQAEPYMRNQSLNIVGETLLYFLTRVRTHKPDSLSGTNVIQARRQQERGFERVPVE